MADQWTKVSDAPLFGEHMVLGGIFDDDEPLLGLPVRYGAGQGEREVLFEGCGLADLVGMTIVLVSGGTAEAFMTTACAGEELAVGECSFGAVVSGDGSVAAVPLVARTGNTEYLLVDPTERGLMLIPWLSFLAGIEQNGYRPFAGVTVEDVSTSLHPLLLWGPEAPGIVGDYLAKDATLPKEGHIKNLSLDRILSLVAAPPCGDIPCYLLLVPPAYARVIWRSLLSFTSVNPVGHEALLAHAQDMLGWLRRLIVEDAPDLDHPALLHHGLARERGGYVGERALKKA